MSNQGCDVAVVGAGLGGLAAAALLARAGRSVTLLDRAPRAGGVCQPLVYEGCRFEAGGTLLTGFAPGAPLHRLWQRLGIDLPVTECDPALQVALPQHRISLWAEGDAWWREIRREFPQDLAGWQALAAELEGLRQERERALRALPPLPPERWGERLRAWRVLSLGGMPFRAAPLGAALKRALTAPFHAVMDRHRLGQRSRQVLEAILWYLALRDPAECSTLEATVVLLHGCYGVVSVAGGVAAMVDALTAQFQKDGGHLRLGTPIARLHCEGDRVRGVVTADGETIPARWVVTDVPPGVLTGTLLPPRRGWLQGRGEADVPWEPTFSAELMLLVVPEALLPSELSGHCCVVRDSRRPARAENLVFVRAAPPWDAGQRPGGVRCLSVGRFVPARPDAREAEVNAELLAAADQLIPGVARAMVSHRLLMPAALAEIWGRPAAAVRYGVESPSWLGQRGARHRLGWTGHFAVGEWTFPGRLVVQVAEAAMRVADLIIAET